MEPARGRPLTWSTESCQSGRMGRSRKPLWLSGHRGFESHALRRNPSSCHCTRIWSQPAPSRRRTGRRARCASGKVACGDLRRWLDRWTSGSGARTLPGWVTAVLLICSGAIPMPSRVHPRPHVVRRIWRFARPYRAALALYLGIIVLAAVLSLAPPLLFREIIDGAVPNGDGGRLDCLAGLIVARRAGRRRPRPGRALPVVADRRGPHLRPAGRAVRPRAGHADRRSSPGATPARSPAG